LKKAKKELMKNPYFIMLAEKKKEKKRKIIAMTILVAGPAAAIFPIFSHLA